MESDNIAKLKREGKDASDLIAEMKELSDKIKEMEQEVKEVEEELERIFMDNP
ncbi:class IIa-like seryl-tRNA synthetase [Thermoanaerobacter ethanolicus JW 200]|nr:class IIa-like seryl-tRNA synthetase [Thermoanaerobacter ethanolicus JW 200]